MIIVDTALRKREAEGKPIRVGVIGAGYMGRGLILQIETAIPGMQVSALYNRTTSVAERAFEDAGIADFDHGTTKSDVEDALRTERRMVCDDPIALCEAEGLDAIVEATGEVEFGAAVSLATLRSGKHLILMNAELDAALGPILKVYADKAGVTVTNVDGDQPGVIMNLFRWVNLIGYQPVLAGNIKGLQDNYRNPETQKGFADKHGQKPKMITSFADGTKISMEMAVVANATGFKVAKRGMLGPECRHVTEATSVFSEDVLSAGGVVDFVLGAEPGPGVFIIGYNDDPRKKQYAKYLKMGDGPYYTFYIPYHLPHLESPLTIARAVLFDDAATQPLGGPVADVVTTAKIDMVAGTVLDGIGGFHSFGQVDNIRQFTTNGYLPMSLSEGCTLKRNIKKDTAIRYDDVELPDGRLCDRLRDEQIEHFGMLASGTQGKTR